MDGWKDVKGYENLYCVNIKGEIYSLISNKILKPFCRGSRPDNKYLVVDLHKNKKGKTISVHRIVAEAFIPNPDNLPCVNHKDGNKYNNHIDNLEWCTYSENNKHAIETGSKRFKTGTKNKLSKLTYDEVVKIKKRLILGDSEYGARPLSKKYGVDHNVILDIYRNIKYSDVKIPYTFFVCSDIHSEYTQWIKALIKAGFNPNKYSHKIIMCGDLFDRMDESQKVYNFAKDMIEKDKLIYIRGNHENLIMSAIKRRYPLSHDWHNGTAKTIIDLAPDAKTFKEACTITYEKIKPLLDKTLNYFETKNFVFCHSWIPVDCKDWRVASQSEWDQAMWFNPLEMAMNGFGIEKTIVSGHWHSSAGWSMEKGLSEFGPDACFEPYYYKDKLIMIDACCAHSGKLNCIVIEDEFLED